MLSGCGDDTNLEESSVNTSESADRPMSTTPPPTIKTPTEPPKSPSDLYPTDRFVGRVISGGSGPCYDVETDEGKLYAVHSPTTGELAVGTTVRVKISPTPSATDCPGGQPVNAAFIEVVQ